ncbi:MAG: hypothetical protein WBL61_09380 [Bryobacteraceae bacterium]
MPITATDVTGLRKTTWEPGSEEASVQDMLEEMVDQLALPMNDSEGAPIAYQARLNSTGRALSSAELVRDAVAPDETVMLMADINAG